MPFSFIDIEERKTKEIIFLFIFLVGFYFFSAWILAVTVKFLLAFQLKMAFHNIAKFPLNQLVIIFCTALLIAVFHWWYSTSSSIPRILTILKSQPLDKEDRYHKRLGNIVEEVSVATGGRKIEAVVLPIYAMNAFSLADSNGRAIIGVTEGLLAKLNRAQLEAVVAHEAAHIVTQDTLIKTIAVSLFSVYGSICEMLKKAMTSGTSSRGSSGRYYRSGNRGGLPFQLIVLYVVVAILYCMSKIISMFISRQCEYRADAVAVRLVRDPLGLARALYKISRGWRGGGVGYESMESLFILNPNYCEADENEGFFSNLFSTHPPIANRMAILLNMAHTNFEALKDLAVQIKKIRSKEVKVVKLKEPRWFASKTGPWEGPFTAVEMASLGWLRFDSFIKREGTAKPILVSSDPELVKLLKENEGQSSGAHLCPRCRQSLSKVLYEGVPIHQCFSCQGVLVEDKKISRILVREEQGFSDELVKKAKLIEDFSKTPFSMRNAKMQNELSCPLCNNQMLRGFYNLAYLIEVDRCFPCGVIWFDKDELEILQYLIEKSESR